MSVYRLFELFISPLTLAVAPPSRATKLDVKFVNHIQAGMPEQDVFIERADVPTGQVVRPTSADIKDSANLAKPLYAAPTSVPDDPFQVGPNPLGPFPKGKALGLTLGEWLAATGRGMYTVRGDDAELDVQFEKLVPNGSYTMLTPRLTLPPHFHIEPGVAGAADGSQAQLKADERGNAKFQLKMKSLPESSKETLTALILAYNSEGQFRGENGKNLHMQLDFIFAAPSGL
jgi:hypothetical protein